MGLTIVDGPMVTGFLEDAAAFDLAADELFANLAADGVLSRPDPADGAVDPSDFRAEMREILLAIARAIGDSPVQMALADASLIMRAVEHDNSRAK